MSNVSRLERLQELLTDNPDDQFLRYGLAMEYRKADRNSESLEVLAGLMKDQTPHVPSFLMAAQQQVEAGEISDARATLREGIEIAREQNEMHAAGEMGELLASLGELGE